LAEIQLVWGCDRSRQFEQAWLQALLQPLQLRLIDADPGAALQRRDPHQPLVLVESGLLRLESQVAADRLQRQRQQRAQRLQQLQPDLLIHISDEEGFDGDSFYGELPASLPVWRNFHHPRLAALHPRLSHFPIGPRVEFLEPGPLRRAADRSWPWAFMGTLWRSGNRTLAASLFLRGMPQGQFHGGRRFGQGVPLDAYKGTLADSVFALCPEGDRHFDTFRLYESLQLGCLPLVVERQQQAVSLLGPDFPLPIFADWPAALAFVQRHWDQRTSLNSLQQAVGAWWIQTKQQLSAAMRRDLSVHP